MPKFAIIGFGSLLWDLGNLEPHVIGEWGYYTGPMLPLEFSLISAKRNQALALTIDLDNGTLCPTCIISSRRQSIVRTVGDLAAREQAPQEMIGFFEQGSNHSRSRSDYIYRKIETWLEQKRFDGAVWTDSASNFKSITGTNFSVIAALEYLRSLQGASLIEAKRYIENAPDLVDTPLRKMLAEEAWWLSLPYP